MKRSARTRKVLCPYIHQYVDDVFCAHTSTKTCSIVLENWAGKCAYLASRLVIRAIFARSGGMHQWPKREEWSAKWLQPETAEWTRLRCNRLNGLIQCPLSHFYYVPLDYSSVPKWWANRDVITEPHTIVFELHEYGSCAAKRQALRMKTCFSTWFLASLGVCLRRGGIDVVGNFLCSWCVAAIHCYMDDTFANRHLDCE